MSTYCDQALAASFLSATPRLHEFMETKPVDMQHLKNTKTLKSGNFSFYAAILIMVAAGVLGLMFSDMIPYSLARKAIDGIALALVIAAFLAGTVDIYLKKRLAIEVTRDVFHAAFHYVLPNELKSEITRIMAYRFMCYHHKLRIEIAHIDDDTVRVTSKVERKIKNISAHPETLRPATVHIDEWGFPKEKSKIVELIVKNDDDESINNAEWNDEEMDSTIKRVVTKPIMIHPGRHIKIFSNTIEIKRVNDIAYWGFTCPTVDPEIEVIIPEDLDHGINFGSASDKSEKEQYGTRYKADGTYMPLHLMSIRWWPKDALSAER